MVFSTLMTACSSLYFVSIASMLPLLEAEVGTFPEIIRCVSMIQVVDSSFGVLLHYPGKTIRIQLDFVHPSVIPIIKT